MKIGVSNSCTGFFPVRRTFEIAEELGLDRVELYYPWLLSKRRLKRIRDDYPDILLGFHAPFCHGLREFWQAVWGDVRKRGRSFLDGFLLTPLWTALSGIGSWNFRRTLQLAKKMGVYVNLHTEAVESSPEKVILFLMAFKRKWGTPLLVENSWAGRATGSQMAVVFAHAIGASGTTFDPVHAGRAGEDLFEAYETMKQGPGGIQVVHFSDWGGGAKEHLVPGDGILPLKKLLQTLAGDGFEGTFVIELFPTFNKRKAQDKVERTRDFILEHGSARA